MLLDFAPMGVELVLVGTHRGDSRETPNPLTGVPEVRTPLVMIGDELRNFRAVLAHHGVAPDAGCGRIAIAKTTVHLDALSIEGARATVEGDLAAASPFLFELVTAGQLLILQHGRCIGTTETALERVRDLDEEFGLAEIATDAPSLSALLASPMEAPVEVPQLSLDD